ncbi:hypothetical protein B0H16DRAFT_1324868 [Mycena metata]|uniref:Uncharacterized protein n=1 Tax=Mycena metata TaxID=1033252 RepID=A0AAD7IBR8_9AGAR|nr:hypothetical protein B0H16DRAFT_1324868 [Mycena metata]
MASTLRAGQYVHYVAPQHQVQQPQSHQVQQQHPTTVSPQDTQHHHVVNSHLVHGNTGTGQQNTHPQPQQQQTLTVPRAGPAVHNSGTTPVVNANASGSGSGNTPVQIQPQPVVAKGNWTKDLVQLAKTAELKKHALTLQLHTAHILSAHAALEQKNRAVQDIKEQRNKLESERARLIECLSQVNEDRNQADLLESTLERERAALRAKISALSEAEYKVAKADVDRLRADLGQPPLPSLQETLDGKGAGYVSSVVLHFFRSFSLLFLLLAPRRAVRVPRQCSPRAWDVVAAGCKAGADGAATSCRWAPRACSLSADHIPRAHWLVSGYYGLHCPQRSFIFFCPFGPAVVNWRSSCDPRMSSRLCLGQRTPRSDSGVLGTG